MFSKYDYPINNREDACDAYTIALKLGLQDTECQIHCDELRQQLKAGTPFTPRTLEMEDFDLRTTNLDLHEYDMQDSVELPDLGLKFDSDGSSEDTADGDWSYNALGGDNLEVSSDNEVEDLS